MELILVALWVTWLTNWRIKMDFAIPLEQLVEYIYQADNQREVENFLLALNEKQKKALNILLQAVHDHGFDHGVESTETSSS